MGVCRPTSNCVACPTPQFLIRTHSLRGRSESCMKSFAPMTPRTIRTKSGNRRRAGSYTDEEDRSQQDCQKRDDRCGDDHLGRAVRRDGGMPAHRVSAAYCPQAAIIFPSVYRGMNRTHCKRGCLFRIEHAVKIVQQVGVLIAGWRIPLWLASRLGMSEV
jgi:hypothetical protein